MLPRTWAKRESLKIKESCSSALSANYKGVYCADVSKLRTTTAGRPLREPDIKDMMQSIANDGWVDTSMPVVTLHLQSDEGSLTHEDSTTFSFRVIDGNHRVVSLQRLLAGERDDQAKVNRDILTTEVNVHVYVRLIASISGSKFIAIACKSR